MGFLKGAVTFCRFRATGADAGGREGIERGLKAFAFRDFFPADAQTNTGWTNSGNILDNSFQRTDHVHGPFLLFALRTDRRVLPAALLKVRFLEAERRFLKEHKATRLYKEQREAIREAVRQELAQRMDPVPTIHEVCWSLGDGTVYFSGLAPRLVQEFVDLFRRSFQTDPVPLTPLAATDDGANGGLPPRFNREFLTWLWYKAEERGGTVSLPDGDEVAIEYIRRLVLEAGEGEYQEQVTCAGRHAGLVEGKDALRQGKLVKEARIRLAHNDIRWEFTYKADSAAFGTMKLPVVVEEEDPGEEDQEGSVLERLYTMETAVRIMDRLHEHFHHLRTSDNWPEVAARMERWVAR
ncbi:MAG: recombination-associated protein RdgC [Syntrophales bacterium]|nr:recombination-associated protein RdgC [Syntrophales bacterium]